MDSRSLPVPDGLDGTRVDAALAKMLGFSRTFAAEVADAGGVAMDGACWRSPTGSAAGPGSRCRGRRRRSRAIVPLAVPDLGIVYDDDDIVVVDKPSGVAAHPSLGWEGPTVLGALAAGGIRVATTGAAERQGIVHRLDVGTSGLMVVAKTERAYTALKRAFKEREVEKIYHAVVQGHPDPLAGTIDAPIGRHPSALVEVRGHARRQGLGHPLRDARGVSAAPRCWRSTSRRGARTRSACTWPRTGIRASAIRSTAATRRCRRASA